MSDDFDDWIPAPGEHPTWSIEEIESHPLFMRDVSGKTNNVHVEALQSVLFDDESPLGIASSLKEQGNEALRLGLMNDAAICYRRALDAGCMDSELLSQIHSNLALAFLEQKKFPECVDECFRAIGENAKNIKAFYRGASASDQLELYSQGIYFAKGGLEVDPDNTELKCLLERMESKRGAQLSANERRNQSSASSTSAGKPKLKYRWRD